MKGKKCWKIVHLDDLNHSSYFYHTNISCYSCCFLNPSQLSENVCLVCVLTSFFVYVTQVSVDCILSNNHSINVHMHKATILLFILNLHLQLKKMFYRRIFLTFLLIKIKKKLFKTKGRRSGRKRKKKVQFSKFTCSKLNLNGEWLMPLRSL